MEHLKQNILIVGNNGASYALAKKLSKTVNVGKIYVAPGDCFGNDVYSPVDIREDDMTGLLKFVLENDVGLTIPVSEQSLKADIVSFFLSNGQNIFGPVKSACNIAVNKVIGKKFLYKIHAQTSKFGIFDKLQMAEDYLKNSNFPVTIKCSEANSLGDRLVCPTVTIAREFLDRLVSKGETNLLIEDYVFGHDFTVYYITDGYSALPLGTVANYKFMKDGDSGILTNGMGCFAPDYKISQLVMARVENIIKNTLVSLDKKGSPYVGIMGIDCTLTGEDKFFVNGFRPFLQDFDASAILNSIDDDLIKIFNACIDGLFSDEYEDILSNNMASVSAVVLSKSENNLINGLELIDDIENVNFIDISKNKDGNYVTKGERAFVLTQTASTLARAKRKLYEDLSEISFEGMLYRKDIGACALSDF